MRQWRVRLMLVMVAPKRYGGFEFLRRRQSADSRVICGCRRADV
jgi:hypothetical protein